ncbi:PIR protein [Plasmodium ovale]|uniref:PIR protein n=1 Tax=Plasmodium ovale TaxID=36330 RepID=A0A1D3JEN5_PLAOA|nr:PIR protein [Plasmodium ovale]
MTPGVTGRDVKDVFKKFVNNYDILEHSDKIIQTGVMESNDPILKSIVSHFIEKYGKALKDSIEKGDEFEQLHCKYLEEWLGYMKYFYTLGGTCEFKKNLWIKYIHKPWQNIESRFRGGNLSCNFNADKFSSSFESEFINFSCNDNNTMSPIIPVSVVFALFGISLICMLLYKFTPMESWIRVNRDKKRKSLQDIYQEGKQELSETFLWNSGENTENNINQLSYHPTRN